MDDVAISNRSADGAAFLSRRGLLKGGGAMVMGFAIGVPEVALAQAARGAKAGPPDYQAVDTWIAIHADNTATLYIGFVELGQGTTTALPQIAAASAADANAAVDGAFFIVGSC